jgi:ribosomal protein S18 acetylase RimI-like enzyme
VLGVLWALARLRTPTPELALLDVAGRFAVAALILRATAAGGMTPLLHGFVASELAGAIAQYWAVRRLRREAAAPSFAAVPVASELQVRAFEERDLEALVALLLEVFPDPAPHNEPRASIERKLGVDRELLLVGHAGGRLVATAMGGWDGHRGWLYQVAVTPEARGHGHGRAIVAAMEARLRARGCAKLNLQVVGSNVAALGFWRGLGYRVEERVSLGKVLAAGERER